MDAAASLNTVHDNGGAGILLQSTTAAQIYKNSIYDNGGNGLGLTVGSGSTVHHNNFYNNSGPYALENGNTSSINAQFNYWGSTATTEMAGGSNPKNIGAIYDFFDDSGRGTVDYANWLGSAATTTPLSSEITKPLNGSVFKATVLTIQGIAVSPLGVDSVEVSPDNGTNWYPATGTTSWSYEWNIPGDGTYVLKSRAIDSSGIETPANDVTVTIDSTLPTTSGILTEDETWSGTVVLTGDVTVPAGTTLTLSPGTTVRFTALSDDQAGGENSDRSELIINGSLSAVGTEAQPIIFTSTSTTPQRGDWDGIRYTNTDGTGSLTMDWCNTGYSNVGIYISTTGAAAETTISITNSTLTDISATGLYVYSSGGATVNATIGNNSLSTIGDHGIYVYANEADSTITGTISGNTISGCENYGMLLYAYTNAVNTLTVSTNTIENSGDAGVYIRGYNYAHANITLSTNTITGSGANASSGARFGIHVYTDTHGFTDVDIDGNTISGSGSHALYADTYNYGDGLLDITNNTVQNNGAIGIYVYPYYSSRIRGSVNNNVLSGNSGRGIYIYANQNYTSMPKSEFDIIGNTIDGTGSNSRAIQYYARYSSLDVTVTGNEVHHATDGIHGQTDNNSTTYTFNTLVSGNDVHDNTGAGIICYRSSASEMYAEVRNNLVYLNGGNGIAVTYNPSYANTVTAVIVSNSVHENGGHGIYNQTTSTTRIVNNSLYFNTGYELYNASSYPVDARFNFWGNEATAEMSSSTTLHNITTIFDQFDDSASGLVNYRDWATASFDNTLPIQSVFIEPRDGSIHPEGPLTLWGLAYAVQGVDRVEISTDNGLTWQDSVTDSRFHGNTLWSLDTPPLYAGNYNIIARVVDGSGQLETPLNQVTVSIDPTAVTKEGSLADDETWSGNIEITGDVVVPEGVTLTILPGTVVHFADNFDSTYSGTDINRTELLINGSLIAEGTQPSQILFSSSAGAPQKGDWSGITVNGSAWISFATVEFSQTGLSFNGNSATDELNVNQCIIQQNTGNGISVYATANAIIQVSITDSTITNNDGTGIWLRSYGGTTDIQATLSGNTISNNGSQGIYCFADGAGANASVHAFIYNNLIENHSDRGIYCYTYNSAISDLTIENNTVRNSAINIVSSSYTADTGSAVLINGNTVEGGTVGIKVYTYNSVLTPQISSNFTSGNNTGIWCESSGSTGYSHSPVLTANQVDNNSEYGIYLLVNQSSTLTDNSIHTNGLYDLYNASSSAVTATENYWGIDTTNEMNNSGYPADITTIFDEFDDNTKGAVNYSNWLSAYGVPADPTLNTVASPTSSVDQVLSGTKESGTTIVLNGVEVVAAGPDTNWTYDMPLTEGLNAINLYAVNSEGMTSNITTSSILRDTIAPEIYSSVPENGANLNRQLNAVEFTLIEKGTEIDGTATLTNADLVRDGSVSITGSWNISYNSITFTPDQPLAAGDYTCTLFPTDSPLANNRTAAIQFTIDLTLPAPPVVDPVASPVNTTLVELTGSKEAGTAVLLDGLQIIPYDELSSWSYQLQVTMEGENNFLLSVQDEAGNTSSSTPLTIVLDRVAPSLVTASPVDGSFINTAPAAITFAFIDTTTALAETETLSSASITDSFSTPVSGTWTLIPPGTVTFTPDTALLEGTYFAALTATDLAGNTTPVSLSFVYDATPPAPPVLHTVTSPTHLESQVISGTKDADSSIWLNGTLIVDNNALTNWSHELFLEEGENTLVIFSKDPAGNQSDSISAVIVYDDISPLPVVQLTADGDGDGTTVVLDWTGYDEAGQGDIASYNIYVETALFTQIGGRTPLTTVAAGTFTFTVENLVQGQTYYFAVTGVDVNGNEPFSVTPVSAIPTDILPPELTGLDWLDNDNSFGLSTGDQYVFHFSEPMEATVIQNGTTDANTHLVPQNGNLYGTVNTSFWNGDTTSLTVTVTEGYTVIGDEIVTPSAAVVDLAGNPVIGTQRLKGKPVLITTVRFDDADGGETVSIGDRYFFTFSQPMDPESLTDNTAEANVNLSPQGKKYGNMNHIQWLNATEVTIEITPGFTITGNETVMPSSQLTDNTGSPVTNAAQLNINDVIAPVVKKVQPLYISPVSAVNDYQLTVQFNASMDTATEPVVGLQSTGSVNPVVPVGGLWITTQFANDTYQTPAIVLSREMNGTLTADVSNGRDKAGNIMASAANVFSTELDADPPANPAVTLQSTTCNSATLSWNGYNAAPDLTGFQIYMSTEGDFSTVDGRSFISFVGSAARSATLDGLSTGTAYHAAVVALDSVGNYTATVEAVPVNMIQPIPPVVPVSILPGDDPETAILSWQGYPIETICGLQGYRVYMEEMNFSSVSNLTPIADLDAATREYTVPRLDRTKTYYFTVVAFNQADEFNDTVSPVAWSDPYSGEISTDLEIGKGIENEITIYQTITVTSGATLTVRPGTTLYFTPGTGIVTENGNFIAEGTALQPIIFTSELDKESSMPAQGDWSGILLSANANGSRLSHIIISYAEDALLLDNCSPTVESYTALRNARGLVLINGANLTTNEAYLRYNDKGVEVYDISSLQISGSVIKNNQIHVEADGSATVTAQNNWWGSVDVNVIDQLMTGIVDYSNFLDFEPVLSPAIGTVTGAVRFGSRQIDLLLASRNGEEMRISEDSSFTDIYFMDFSRTSSFELSEGGGSKTIYAQFKSPTGTLSDLVALTVEYSTEGPVIDTFSLIEGQILTRPLTVTGSATAQTGLDTLQFYVDDQLVASQENGTALSFFWDIRETTSALHRVKLTATDSIGNQATLGRNVIVQPAAPPQPVITVPVNGLLLTTDLVTIQGTAEPNITVILMNNGQIVARDVTDVNGEFSFTDQDIYEGDNTFTAVTEDFLGSSPLSDPVLVVLDAESPSAPANFSITALSPGGLQLVWEFAQTGENPSNYRVYRSTSSFIDPTSADLIADKVTQLNYRDYPPVDGVYFYGVTGVDRAGNESILSPVLSISYDGTAPTMTIEFDTGMPTGTGEIGFILTIDEALAAVPAVTALPAGLTVPLAAVLNKLDELTYTGTFDVPESTPSGDAVINVSGVDLTGNIFTGQPQGDILTIDSSGPSADLTLNPSGLVQVLTDVDVSVLITLDEPVRGGTTPTLRFTPPTGGDVDITLSGSAESWSGTLTLQPSMGSGIGRFFLEAEDYSGNIGTIVTSDNTIELYNTAVPDPAEPPQGVQVNALADGRAAVSWNPAPRAETYTVYRKPGVCDVEPDQPVLENTVAAEYIDTPPTDGLYCYGITSVRRSAESALSSLVTVVVDRVAPASPENENISLDTDGIRLIWSRPSSGEVPIGYTIYRNGTALGTMQDSGPVMQYLDHPETGGTYTYRISSFDSVGNESAGSELQQNLLVGAVVDLQVFVDAGSPPFLSWANTDPSATGYNVYRGGVKLNTAPLTETSFEDTFYAGNSAAAYDVSAVNGAGDEGPFQHVTVVPLTFSAVSNLDEDGYYSPLVTNYFNTLDITLANADTVKDITLESVEYRITVQGTETYLSGKELNQNISPLTAWTDRIVLPPPASTDTHILRMTARSSNPAGNVSIYQAYTLFEEISQPGDMIALMTDSLPVAGSYAAVSVRINNHGYADMNLAVNHSNGNEPGDFYITIENAEGLEMGRAYYQGTPPGTFVVDGTGFVSIAPGENITLDMQILIPANLTEGDILTFRGEIDKYSNDSNNITQQSSTPLAGIMQSAVSFTPYSGTAQADKNSYSGNEVITINGQAINRDTGLPEPDVPLKIGFQVRGYTWYEDVMTDAAGNYVFSYNPTEGISGEYLVWAAHPEVFDTLNQDAFSLYRVYPRPSYGEISLGKGESLNFQIHLYNPGETALTSLTTTFRAYTMDGDTEVEVPEISGSADISADVTVEPGGSELITLNIAAAVDAPDAVNVEYRFSTAEGAQTVFTGGVSLAEATPMITIENPSAGYVDISINRGTIVTVPVTISNRGLKDMTDVIITLPQDVTWMTSNLIQSSPGVVSLGDIPVGEYRTFDVVFLPPSDIDFGYYNDTVTITGSNTTQPYEVNLYAKVTTAETGSVLFKVVNILGQEVEGARVRLRNESLYEEVSGYLTNATGEVVVDDLKEGQWSYQVIAAGHSTAGGVVQVQADNTVLEEVFPEKSLVTIQFIVEPIPFTDRYEIKVEQTFETHVPLPVLVVDPPYLQYDGVLPGFATEFVATVSNKGLVKIEDVEISSADVLGAHLTPLINYIPEIKPGESIKIPYRVSYSGDGSILPGDGDEVDPTAATVTKTLKDVVFKALECLPGGTGGKFDGSIAQAVINIQTILKGRGYCRFTSQEEAEELANIASVILITFTYAQEVAALKEPPGVGEVAKAVIINAAKCAAQEMGKAIAEKITENEPPEKKNIPDDTGSFGAGGKEKTKTGPHGGAGPASLTSWEGIMAAACFTAGTPIMLANGEQQAIEQIQIGDKVLTLDGDVARVSRVYTRQSDHIREITYHPISNNLLDQDQENTLYRVETTDEHLFWVKEKGWMPAGTLQIGDQLILADNRLAEVAGTRSYVQPVTVYNMDVEGLSTYFANGVLVHQQCDNASVSVPNRLRMMLKNWGRKDHLTKPPNRLKIELSDDGASRQDIINGEEQ